MFYSPEFFFSNLIKYNNTKDGTKTHAEQRNKREIPSVTYRKPLIILVLIKPRFARPLKIENCVAPIRGLVTSINIALNEVK